MFTLRIILLLRRYLLQYNNDLLLFCRPSFLKSGIWSLTLVAFMGEVCCWAGEGEGRINGISEEVSDSDLHGGRRADLYRERSNFSDLKLRAYLSHAVSFFLPSIKKSFEINQLLNRCFVVHCLHEQIEKQQALWVHKDLLCVVLGSLMIVLVLLQQFSYCLVSMLLSILFSFKA